MQDISDPGAPLSRRTFLAGSATAAALSISSFAEASQIAIPPETDIVRTPGFARAGRGSALYVADAAVDRAYQAANPRTAFVSANGRGFRLSLDQTITPFMFGAIGADAFHGDTAVLPDDTAALQAYFDFCARRRVEGANWGGIFGITAELVVGGPFGERQGSVVDTMAFEGAIVLGVKSNIDGAALRVRTRTGCSYGPITVTSNDFYDNFAGRLFDFGVVVEDRAHLQFFSTVQVSFARVAGLFCSTAFIPDRLKPSSALSIYSNTFANHFGNCHFYACGSGSLHAGSFLAADFSSRADAGSAGSYDQTTTMRTTALPPALVEGYGIPLFARILGQLYSIRKINRSAGTVTVYPWVDRNAGTSESLQYVYGGGMVLEGGDAGIQSGKTSAINCSAGLVNAALYNGHFVSTMQSNLIGVVAGSGPFNSALGGSMDGYFEANEIDLLWNMVNFSDTGFFTLSSQHALDPGKIKRFSPRRGDNQLTSVPITGLMINAGHIWQTFENGRDGAGNFAAADIIFHRPNAVVVPLHSDNPLLNIIAPGGTTLTDLFGYRARTVQITGTGPGNAPAGTLTVVPGGKTKKVNGGTAGANATFTGFTRPATVQVAIDPADADNFLVSFMGGK